MSDAREHAARLLRAYQAQEKRFVERRFPLEFAPEVPVLRELYSQGKGLRWNPETDIAWDRLDPSRYEKTTREAASRTWSRRAWSVYPGLTESTALLIRFCLESGSLGMDAKLFLSFRPAEEAKHLEVCHMLAERFGGYTAASGQPGLAHVSNHAFGQAALDGDLPVEAYIAALGALDDQLDLNLYLSHLQQAKDEIVRAALRLIAVDRAAVAAAVSDMLANVILAGYRNTWLLPEKSREPWLLAEAETARAGLGASSAAQERSVLRATVAQVRERLAAWKLELPRVAHAELGAV